MAFKQADLDAIDRAIASGHRVVQFVDKRIEFRSVDELIRSRDRIALEMAGQEGRTPSRIKRIAHGGKGI